MEPSMTEFWLITRLDSDECGKPKQEGERNEKYVLGEQRGVKTMKEE